MKKQHKVWSIICAVYAVSFLVIIGQPGLWGVVFPAVALGLLSYYLWRGPKTGIANDKVKITSTRNIQEEAPDTYHSDVNYSPLPEVQIYIIYDDMGGKRTERNIITKWIGQNKKGQYYIKALCLYAHAERTFRVDRIRKMIVDGAEVDPETFLIELSSGELGIPT
jgi:hypothetical protein